MNKQSIVKYSFIHAISATAYISLIVFFMNNAEKFLGPVQKPLGGLLFLLIFVVSAGTMGMLVFGRPIMWYLDGKKKEGVILAISTLACLAIFAIVLFLSLALSANL